MKRTIDADKILTYIIIFLALASGMVANRFAIYDLRDRIDANDIEIKALRNLDSRPYTRPNLILPAGVHWTPHTELANL